MGKTIMQAQTSNPQQDGKGHGKQKGTEKEFDIYRAKSTLDGLLRAIPKDDPRYEEVIEFLEKAVTAVEIEIAYIER